MKLKDTLINSIEVEFDLNSNIWIWIIERIDCERMNKIVKGFSKKYKMRGIQKNVLVWLLEFSNQYFNATLFSKGIWNFSPDSINSSGL